MKKTNAFTRKFALFLAVIIMAASVPVITPSAAKFNKKAKVQSLKTASVTKTSVKLKWKKQKGATGYQVYRATKAKGAYKKIATTTKLSYKNTKLKAGKTYYYKVRAYTGRKQKKANKSKYQYQYGAFSKVLKVTTKASKTEAPTTEAPTEAPTTEAEEPTTAAPTTEEQKQTTEEPKPTEAEEPTTTTEEPVIEAASYRQDLDYSESTDRILNPDQGFYRPLSVTMTPDGVTYTKSRILKDARLFHLRIDISAFSKANNGEADLDFTEAAFDGIDELLAYMREQDKNAIVRFAYPPKFGAETDREPSLSQMVRHIEQVCPILDRYPDVITAVEVGLVGPWGEMHDSAYDNDDAFRALIDAFLNHTTELPVLVRRPNIMYGYLQISLADIPDYTIAPESGAYRLGLFNDGYLGSQTDLGTYTSREKEIPWLAKQTAHLPYGGEVAEKNSVYHNIENCTQEMFDLHLSYLNLEWNNDVVAKWKDTLYTEAAGSDARYYGKTAFTFIENHMGYRPVLRNSVFTYREDVSEFGARLEIENVGFGNLNKEKQATLLFVNEADVVTAVNAGAFSGAEEADTGRTAAFTCNVAPKLAAGTYTVYLRLDAGNEKYAVRFANDLWNETLKANRIGTVIVP